MDEFDLPQVLTVDEAARALRVSPESIRRWLRDGLIQGVKFGHVWRVARDEVLRVMQEGVEPNPVVLAGGRVHPAVSAVVRDPVSVGEPRQASGRALHPRVIG